MYPSLGRLKSAFSILLVVIGPFAVIPALSAKTRPGIRIEVVQTDGTELVGELIAVRPATLVVADPMAGFYEFIDMADIRIVRIPKVSKALGAFNGFIQGGFYGVIIGDLSAGRKAPSSEHRNRAIIGGAIGGAVMSILGGIKGRPTKGLEVIQIKGQAPADLAAILERLRTLARVKEAS